MFKALLRLQLLSLFSSFSIKNKQNKRKNALQGIALFLLLVGCLGFSFGSMFYTVFSAVIPPLASKDMMWIYFSLTGLIAFSLSFFGSIFTAYTQLYDAKDNEQLLALPFSPWMILASRMIALLVVNLATGGFIFAISLFAFASTIPLTLGIVCASLMALIGLSLFSLACSCVLGWLIALITSNMKNKTPFQLILSILFLFGYFTVVSKAEKWTSYFLSIQPTTFSEIIQAHLFPLDLLGKGIMGNMGHLGVFLLCMVLPFMLVYAVLSKSLNYLLTKQKGGKRAVYHKKALHVTNPQSALVKKDLSRFFHNASYMLNCGLGLIITLGGAIYLAITKNSLIPTSEVLVNTMFQGGNLTEIMDFICVGLILLVCFLASLNPVSAPSISLEGVTLWLLHSLPIDTKKILMAKVKTHALICFPPVFLSMFILACLFPFSWIARAFLVIIPLLFNGLVGLLGVLMNLRFPNFHWVNETACVKRSMSVNLTMFLSMAFVLLIGYFIITNLFSVVSVPFLLGCFTALIVLLLAGGILLLNTWGVKKFMKLGK